MRFSFSHCRMENITPFGAEFDHVAKGAGIILLDGRASQLESTAVIAPMRPPKCPWSVSWVTSCEKTGGVRCWGYNEYGQCNSARERRANRRRSHCGGRAMAAGNGCMCALTITGGVRCWGFNGNGQLGDGNALAIPLPRQVLGTCE
jgi:hypothetical protein